MISSIELYDMGSIVVYRIDQCSQSVIDSLSTLCPPERKRLIYGRLASVTNDLRMLLEDVESFDGAYLAIAYYNTQPIGWGLAYAGILSLYVDPICRRRGYATNLAIALRRYTGDVIVGCTPEGIAFQKAFDRSRSYLKRMFFWIWRRRPCFQMWWDFRSWGLCVSVPWTFRVDLQFLCLRLNAAFFVRCGAPLTCSCDHGVLLSTSCKDCEGIQS